jgi:molecular chaperone GrpE
MDIYICENIRNLLPPIDLMEEIRRLQEELIDERERNLRAHADFKNYRRRIERDGNMITKENKREVLLAMLDIIDDLEKVLQLASGTDQSSIERVQIIHKKSLVLLETYGVYPFECIGMQFNQNLHEAVAMANHEGSEPRIVVDELRRGYFWDKELLRPAQVRVTG